MAVTYFYEGNSKSDGQDFESHSEGEEFSYQCWFPFKRTPAAAIEFYTRIKHVSQYAIKGRIHYQTAYC